MKKFIKAHYGKGIFAFVVALPFYGIYLFTEYDTWEVWSMFITVLFLFLLFMSPFINLSRRGQRK